MTKMDVLVLSGIVAVVAFVCFTMGMLVRRSSDQDLIEQLETELDARQQLRPAEIATEPVCAGHDHSELLAKAGAAPWVLESARPAGSLTPAMIGHAMGKMWSETADTTWDLPALTKTPPQGFIALPDWHADRTVDLDEHIAVMGAELQEYVAMLIAASQDA